MKYTIVIDVDARNDKEVKTLLDPIMHRIRSAEITSTDPSGLKSITMLKVLPRLTVTSKTIPLFPKKD